MTNDWLKRENRVVVEFPASCSVDSLLLVSLWWAKKNVNSKRQDHVQVFSKKLHRRYKSLAYIMSASITRR